MPSTAHPFCLYLYPSFRHSNSIYQPDVISAFLYVRAMIRWTSSVWPCMLDLILPHTRASCSLHAYFGLRLEIRWPSLQSSAYASHKPDHLRPKKKVQPAQPFFSFFLSRIRSPQYCSSSRSYSPARRVPPTDWTFLGPWMNPLQPSPKPFGPTWLNVAARVQCQPARNLHRRP